MPQNPEGQLCWYGLKDLNEHHHLRHKQDFEDARKHRSRKRVDVVFGRLAGIDPLYTGTMHAMERHMRRQTPTGRQALQGMFERGPDEALDFYREMRAAAEIASTIYHARRMRRDQEVA